MTYSDDAGVPATGSRPTAYCPGSPVPADVSADPENERAQKRGVSRETAFYDADPSGSHYCPKCGAIAGYMSGKHRVCLNHDAPVLCVLDRASLR